MKDFSAADARINELIAAGSFPSATLCVYHHGKIIHEAAYGAPDIETKKENNVNMAYDLASISKLFATTAFISLVEEGIFSLDEPISKSFSAFTGEREIRASANELVKIENDPVLGYAKVDDITWYNVLIHNAGLGWTQLQKNPSVEAAVNKMLSMPFAYQPKETVLYTDLGLILMGMAMEIRTGKRLDELVAERVCKPMGLSNTGYMRVSAGAKPETTAPTEYCAWRGCRMHGLVHDENAYFLDGVAGHAGVFSTARDVATLGQDYLNALQGKKAVISREMAERMTTFQQQNSWDRRGIGFQLRIIEVGAHTFPLSLKTFGHTGFTGTCMWVDPERDMAFALLTNDVYGGRENRTLAAVRKSIVERIVEAVDRI